MSTSSTIADYIQHNRNLGKRFVAEEAVLLAFSRSVGKAPLHGIDEAMITRFVNRDGASVETIARKHRVLVGFFRYAIARCGLHPCRASNESVVRHPSPPISSPRPS